MMSATSALFLYHSPPDVMISANENNKHNVLGAVLAYFRIAIEIA